MKSRINSVIRRIPGAGIVVGAIYGPICAVMRRISARSKAKSLAAQDAEGVFTDIYKNRSWTKGKQTVSGGGSDLEQTERIRTELPVLFKDLQVLSILDIPCGDFWWMKEVDMGNVSYTGADIVLDMVESNRQYENESRSFRQLDLIKDALPEVDLIFVRDCLVHLSFSDISSALRNIVSSKSRYLLTTTFTDRKENRNIATGQWRALNLQVAPFSFPEPVRIINEEHPKEQYADKSMGLWKIADIGKCLEGLPGE